MRDERHPLYRPNEKHGFVNSIWAPFVFLAVLFAVLFALAAHERHGARHHGASGNEQRVQEHSPSTAE